MFHDHANIKRLYEVSYVAPAANMQWGGEDLFQKGLRACAVRKTPFFTFLQLLLYKTLFSEFSVLQDSSLSKYHKISQISVQNA